MKRNLPVAVWQLIQPIIDKYRSLVIPVVSQEHALELWDSVPGTGFYFKCSNINDNDIAKYRVEHVPHSVNSNTVNRQDVELKDVAIYLEQWFQALDLYDKLVTVYDDPILKSYQQEFTGYFAMQDEDADRAPFDFVKQIYLDQYLVSIKALLENRKEGATPEQAKELEVIIEECESLSQDMTVLTKNQTISRLATIWARGRRYGLDLIKEFMAEFKKELVKTIVKSTLEGGSPLLDQAMDLIS